MSHFFKKYLMTNASLYLSILITAFFLLARPALAIEKKVITSKNAQAAHPQVEIYSDADFDSEVIQTIEPGTLYLISNKPKGPFYQIKLKNGQRGYVPDTELDIEGEGVFQPRSFQADELDEKKIKNKKNNKKTEDDSEDETQDETDSDSEKMSFHAMTFQLINYHEDTMGGLQIGDLYAIGYRNYLQMSEFSSSWAWDILGAFRAPAYYQQLTGQSASGFAVWSDFEIVNISPLGSNTTLHYGAGPFLKYTQFDVKSSVRNYSLQDMTVGLFFETGLILHFQQLSYDLSLRYYLDKKSYGALGFGVLF